MLSILRILAKFMSCHYLFSIILVELTRRKERNEQMDDSGLYMDEHSPEEDSVGSALEDGIQMPDNKEPENDLVHANGETSNYLKEKKINTLRFWVALILTITFCVITVVCIVAGIVKGDPNMLERVLLPFSFVMGAVVGYLFKA